MNKIDIAQKAVGYIVSAGTMHIASSIIKNNTDPDTIVKKVEIAGAGLVIGQMASVATRKYTDEKIQAIADWWKINITEKSEK